MKKILISLAAATLLGAPFAAHAERIGVAMSAFDDNFLTVLRTAMSTRAAKQPGLSLQFEDAQLDMGKQMSQIQNFIAEKVDAIIVNPVDTTITPKLTRMVVAAGIPLVYVNRAPSDKTLPPNVAFVGSQESQAGMLQMQTVCKMLGGKGNILIMMGDLSNQSTGERTQAVKDVIAKAPCNGIKVVDARSAQWTRTGGSDLMNNWLSSGLQFNAVIANNDEMALGAIQALKAAHKLNGIVVAGIDATPDAQAAMKAGDLAVTVFQNAVAQGAGSVDTALKLAHHEPTPAQVWIPFETVTKANLASYIDKH